MKKESVNVVNHTKTASKNNNRKILKEKSEKWENRFMAT